MARVENQIRIFAVQFPAGKASEFFVELLVEPTNGARAKTVPASSSLIALIFRVDTPRMYISVKPAPAPSRCADTH
jgi:hypothetical protein